MERQNAAPSQSSAIFRNEYPTFADPTQGSNGMARNGEALRRHRAVADAWRRAATQGWEYATVVNLHSFDLDLNMGPLGHLTIPRKRQRERFRAMLLDEPRMDMQDQGDAKFIPVPVYPKEMAADLVRYYSETGGVFWYTGKERPSEDLLQAAEKRLLDWYFQLYNEANSNWAQFARNPKYITDRMRDAGKALFAQKLINSQPEWVVISRAESPDQPCDGCGNVVSKLAKFCPTCDTIYDAEWVKARRPDLWRAQNPEIGTIKSTPGAQGSGTDAGIEGLIKAQKIADEKPPQAEQKK